MKKLFFTTACIFSVLLLPLGQGKTQSISYTLDSTAFSAISLETGPTQVRFADLNKDGHLDVVSIGDHGSPNINANEHGITVFLGNGTASNWQLYQSGGFGYGGCAVGDLNNDGNPDIAYSMHHNYGGAGGTKIIEAQLGDGSGMSWTPYDGGLVTGGETYGMRGTDLGDVNNDGLLDLGSNSMGASQGVHIYKNLGTGNWQHIFSAGQGGGAGNNLQFGDMNGDGNLDFAVTSEFGATFFGDGNGGFTMKTNGLPPVTTAYDHYGDVSLADIDNDGAEELAFTYDGGVYVYKWNESSQQWNQKFSSLPSTDNYLIVRLADMDADGFTDLITINGTTMKLEIWKGNGGTSWTNMYSFSMPATFSAAIDIAIADADHNGYPDMLLWGQFTTSMFTYGNKIWLFKAAVTASALNVTETYPQGNECFPNNAVRFIHWISAVPNNNSSSVKIEYSTSGNSGPWNLISSSAPNNGTYQWNVPASVNSSNCYIRVTATDNVSSATAVSMNVNPFSIGCNSATGISEENNTADISVFPNPFSSSTTVSSEIKNGSIKIFDVTGNIVKNFSNVNSFPSTIEKGNLSSGLYFLELNSESKIERMKLIVE